jgi:beta-lactamase class A
VPTASTTQTTGAPVPSPSVSPVAAPTVASSVAPVATWDEFAVELGKLASDASALVAEIGDGRCGTGSDFKPVHAVDATRPLAIATASRLYILGALAREIDEKRASWTEKLALRDDWKSPLGGTLKDEPAGTSHPLAYYAEEMINNDDGTAADHLLRRLGRETVEASLGQMGMPDTSRSVPFLASRDLGVLKATRNAGLADQYVAADPQGRRNLLDGVISTTPVTAQDLADWTSPRDIKTLDWFASTTDLCYAMLGLRDDAARPGLERIRTVLSANPGVHADPAAWKYVGFIRGVEPGVDQLTWLLERADGRWFVVSITLNDTTRPLTDPTAPIALVSDALRLVAAAP